MPHQEPDLAKEVRLVIDCPGHEAAVLDGCNIVVQKGEVVQVGVPWRRFTDHTAHEIMQAVFVNFVRLRSGWEWEVPIRSSGFVWEELLEGYNNASHSTFSGFERALRWLDEGRLDLSALTHRMKPDDPMELYERIGTRAIEDPFIVLDWSE